MNGNKLKLTQYSDDVIRDLDIHVEYYIKYNIHLNNQQLFDEVNATREEYIQEIRACEAYNASFLRDEDREIDLPNEQIFKKFCFGIVIFKKIFENDMFSWRLFVTDKYLTRGQVACFQEILKFIPCHSIREIEDEDNDVFDIKPNITFARQSLEKLFSNIQIEEDVRDCIFNFIFNSFKFAACLNYDFEGPNEQILYRAPIQSDQQQWFA
jgi:hypothetical protein